MRRITIAALNHAFDIMDAYYEQNKEKCYGVSSCVSKPKRNRKHELGTYLGQS